MVLLFEKTSEALMKTVDPIEITFQQSVERAYHTAGYLLRTHLGAHTSEDVVSILIEKEIRMGKSLAEIQEILSGPGIYSRLKNVKNDIFRWETAVKRGRGQPSVSFEDAEPFVGSSTDGPETKLIQKEDLARMNDLLSRLFEKVELSETQTKILQLDLQGWSSQRIARDLGIDVDTVYARRSEALRKLASAARRLYKINR
jgi:DNA-directed RNA polymerase specialized sigma24 family protein